MTLNPALVKDYLVSGDAEHITNQEIVMFINLCKYQGLNPFLREAYLVKFGKNAAQIVVGKGALEKRAARCEKYKGFEAGIIVQRQDGTIENRTGTFCLPEERLVGGWAKVYVDGFSHPVEAAVSIQEYHTGKALWASKPATMIRKVAKSQALREAFPEDMQGLYEAEESGISAEDLPDEPIDVQAQPVQQEIIEAQVVEPADNFDDADEFAAIMEG